MSSSRDSLEPGSAGLAPEDVVLLRRRAARLAARAEREAEAAFEAVVFERGGTRWAIAIEHLREIRPVRGLCALPGASAAVPGVLYHRGEILSVHELRALFGAPAAAPARWVVVVERSARRMGLLADEVHSVRAVRQGDLRPAPIHLESEGALLGVLPDDVLVLHPPALFADPRFARAAAI